MSDRPAVTVICATRNARDAVRLTFHSFRRYTPEPCTVLVADNGSSDGTLDDLREMPWLTVISLAERRAQLEAERERVRAQVALMNARLEIYAGGLPANQRALLVAGQFKPPEPLDDARLTLHCETLDWLAARVETPFFLTLDSDVEFLATGWLSEMLDLASRDGLVALGQYEPGRAGYRPRLAPYVLLVRTAAFRALRASFRGHARIADPDEARRWQARPPSLNLDLEELASFRSAMFYTTGAAFFERLEQSGARWADLPATTARKFHHLGHMSWAADEQDTLPGTPALRRAHLARLNYVRQRLDQYPGSL